MAKPMSRATIQQSRINRRTPFAELPEQLKPEEARAFLGLSRTKIYELVRTNAIAHTRYGRTIRIFRSALAPTSEAQ